MWGTRTRNSRFPAGMEERKAKTTADSLREWKNKKSKS
jgi:hypothetical protein